MARLMAESLGMFVVTLAFLLVVYFIANINTHKATGIGWLHMRGIVLMGVGVLYLVLGFILTRWRM